MATTPIWTYRGVDTGVDLTGYEVEARDGSIGTVEESTMQAGQNYLVVDTGPWIFGRRVLLPAGVVERVDSGAEKIFVSRMREEIKNAPEYEAGATDLHRQRIGSYYGGLGEPQPAGRPAQRGTTSGRRLPTSSRRSTSRRQTSSRKTTKQSGSSRGRTRAQSRSRSKTSDGPTRDELYEQAKRLEIDGRSKMNKAQLARAVGRKRGGSSSAQSRRSSSTRNRRSSTGPRRKANPVEVQTFLEGVSYPTRKGDLLREAERKGASRKVRSTLERLPNERFADPTEVSEAVGKLR